jgi:hypothetical protein
MGPAVLLQLWESPQGRGVSETLLALSILEAIPDAVAAVNQHGVIVHVNSHTVFCAAGGSCGSSNA